MSRKLVRVDNGIIIASNVYSNFKSISKERPMSLMRVRGEVLIERQIEALREAGIEDIYVVVGQGIRDFEYLEDKYGLELVEMEEDLTGSLAALYRVRDRLRNSYILNSTDYVVDNLYREFESRSWHCMVRTRRYTKKKVARLDENDRIVELRNGGYRSEFLYGSAFFNEKFSASMRELLEDYHLESTKDMDWQDILRDNIYELEIYGNLRDYGAIYSFDSLDELQRLDIGSSIDERKLVDLLANIMEVEPGEIGGIVEMGHGMTNDSMLFEYGGREYIIRVPGMGTDTLINREYEYLNYRAIRDMDISDRVVYMNERTGVKITEFEKNSRILSLDREEEVEEAFAIIRRLHTSGIVVDHDFDLVERLKYYEALCWEREVDFLEGYEKMKSNVLKEIEVLDGMDIDQVFCHIDPVDENFLVLEGGGMILIDWEYSSMADPLIDLAMFSLHGGLGRLGVERVMELYFEREPSLDERLRVYIYMSMCGLLWYLWAEYKGALGEDFNDYKLRMFQTSEDFYEEVLRI